MRRRKTPKRRPTQQRARETVEIIIQATTQILSKDGSAALTTNRVAERAGVSIGTLYQYFDDKEALVDEVRRRYDAAFRERLFSVASDVAGESLPMAIEVLVGLLVRLHAEDFGLHNAVASEARDDERPMLEQLIASYLAVHRDEVRRPDLQLAAAVTLQVAESLIHDTAVRKPQLLEDDGFVGEVKDVLIRYLVR